MGEQVLKSIAILSATGTARKRTIPAIRERNICNIAAVHGRDKEKLAAMASEFSIPQFYVDPVELLDTVHPDFVFLGSPPSMHLEQIRMCVERGIPILCEKPLCLSSKEAVEIQKLETRTAIHVRIAHHLRHQPGILAIRNYIDSGLLGNLRRVSMQWSFWLNEKAPSAIWKLNPVSGGRHAFYDAGVHAIDLMLYLCPPAEQVAAIAATRSRFTETADNVSAIILCNGVTVELNASQSMRFPRNEMLLDFEGGTIQVPNALGEKPFQEMHVFDSSGRNTNKFTPLNPYGEELVDFIRLLKGESAVCTTVGDAVRAIEILDAITKSIDTNTIISLANKK